MLSSRYQRGTIPERKAATTYPQFRIFTCRNRPYCTGGRRAAVKYRGRRCRFELIWTGQILSYSCFSSSLLNLRPLMPVAHIFKLVGRVPWVYLASLINLFLVNILCKLHIIHCCRNTPLLSRLSHSVSWICSTRVQQRCLWTSAKAYTWIPVSMALFQPSCGVGTKKGALGVVLILILTGGNWQKWKRVFLTCPFHKIYRDKAVGLKSCKYTWKITKFVKMGNLGRYRENLIFCQ